MRVDATVEPTGKVADFPCPSCGGSALDEVWVSRQIRALYLIPVRKDELHGFRCRECSASFIRQNSLSRWIDVALMAGGSLLVMACSLLPVSWWGIRLFTGGSDVTTKVVWIWGILFVSSVAVCFFPIRSLLRRLRAAAGQELTRMNDSFSAAL